VGPRTDTATDRYGVRVAAGAELLRQNHIARFEELFPQQSAHLDWTAEELRRAQDRGLRQLVARAAARASRSLH
jgi:hypothetical protein